MSDAVLNDVLTIQTPITGQLEYKNTVIEAYSGVAQAFNHTEHDRMIYSIDLSALTRTERDSFFDFIKDRKGLYDEFLFEDIADNFVSRTLIGTGDGATTDFQLIDDKDNKRWDPKSTPTDVRIWQGGTEIFSGYSIDYTRSGIVTFTLAPSFGQAIEAEFYFRRRMRFTEDVIGWTEVNNLNVVSTIRMKEVIVP
jgi:uncharacterized protein (TIGR02217 family)